MAVELRDFIYIKINLSVRIGGGKVKSKVLLGEPRAAQSRLVYTAFKSDLL